MPEHRTIYFLSGLGADWRAFQYLRLPEGYRAVPLEWRPPLKNEPLRSYAGRLATEIHGENPILAGLSFGGIVAQEIARIKPVSQLVLISTVKSKKEMPPWFRLASALRLHWIMGKWMLVFPKFIPYFFFSVKNEPEKRLLDIILRDMDPEFLRWAVKSALRWRGGSLNTPVYHIHGDSDRIFPLQYLKPDRVIKGAGHLAVITHWKEVSDSIAFYFDSKPS